MEFELKSDWQDTQVELLKSLHGFEVANVDDEIGIVDYVTEDGDEGKRLLRVIVDPDFKASRANFKIAAKTLEFVEDGSYDEAIVMAKGFTKASERLLRKEEKLEYVSPENEHHSLVELIEGVHNLTEELCEAKCGKYPTSEDDCKGYQDGEYTCPVRRVSDDADFHIERVWLELLMNDFSRLVALRREL